MKQALLYIAITFFFLPSLKAEQTYDVVVAKDGSGDVTTVQEAINTCRAYRTETRVIFIKNGIYKEKVVIPSFLGHIHIIGESRDSTIITWDDHAGKNGLGTYQSHTFKVEGNDVVLENLTIENAAGRVGQAVALHIDGDCVSVINCKLLGNQDTLYATGRLSRQYYKNCYIEGTTDFIFGSAIAVFDRCTIHSKTNSYITAASTHEGLKFGYVFLDCKLTSDPEATRVYLGRPWRDFAQVVFIRCEMGGHIIPEGWHNWSQPNREKTTFYAEYGCKGPGASREGRVSWSYALTDEQAASYTLDNIFSLTTSWNPAK